MLRVVWVLRWLTPARPSAHQHETPYEPWMPERERLGNVSTDREPKDVRLRKAEGINKVRSMFCHRVNCVGRLAARTRNTGIVEQDHRAILCKSVGDGGIPMVHPAPEVLHKEHRHSRIFSEPPVSE